nr:transposase [Thiogranum longum]
MSVAIRSLPLNRRRRLTCTRPAISEKRLSLTNQGKVCYELKTRIVVARPTSSRMRHYISLSSIN